MRRASARSHLRDVAGRPPDEVGGVSTDDKQPLASHSGCPVAAPAPARSRLLVTIIVVISLSVNPASRRASAIRASPSSTGGFWGCPRSVVTIVASAPVALMFSVILDQSYFPVKGVVKQRSR